MLFLKNREADITNPIFQKRSRKDNNVEVLINGQYIPTRGFWPIIDENYSETPFLAIGHKDGVPKREYNKFKKNYGKRFKYIYVCQSAPFLLKNYKYISRKFDGIFDLDWVTKKNFSKSLYCNHSMMVRSMPYRGFFWESKKMAKPFDFSMLTWGPSDTRIKRWDRGSKICDYLLKKGMKGIIVTQKGKRGDFLNNSIKPYIESGNLVIEDAVFSEIEFHHLMCKAKYAIFPNTVDAFPKHIIESLLADKPIIISKDLLLGRDVLSKLGDSVCSIIDFEKKLFIETIYQIISKEYKGPSPRRTWLERYNFLSLSEQWAKEFNRLFGTNYKRLFYMNHIPRIEENNFNSKN